MEDDVIFYDRLVNSKAIWYYLRPFGYLMWPFSTFFPFWYITSRKIWQPRSVRFKVIASEIIFAILSFGTFFHFWYILQKKNLAALVCENARDRPTADPGNDVQK
jgi:hypothetical protein